MRFGVFPVRLVVARPAFAQVRRVAFDLVPIERFPDFRVPAGAAPVFHVLRLLGWCEPRSVRSVIPWLAPFARFGVFPVRLVVARPAFSPTRCALSVREPSERSRGPRDSAVVLRAVYAPRPHVLCDLRRVRQGPSPTDLSAPVQVSHARPGVVQPAFAQDWRSLSVRAPIEHFPGFLVRPLAVP